MRYQKLLKRIVPFVSALILGLFIASFFVSLEPSFKFRGRSFYRQMKEENRALKMEVARLRSELEEQKNSPNCEEAEYKRFKLDHEGEIPVLVTKDRINSNGVGHGYGEGHAPAPPKAVKR
jgi:hypothetical protein